jgi:hypothetical protein
MVAMQPVAQRNIFWTVFAVIAVALALSGSVDRLGEANAGAAFKRALVTFAVSRALNGAISVAQGTELAIEPAGVGVILSLGQVLDPINDLVERFSTVMLVATSSLGLQNILLQITSSWGFDLALGLIAVLVVVTAWVPATGVQKWSQLTRRLMLCIVFIRFAVPLLIIASSFVFDVYLEAEQTAAIEALEGVQTKIDRLNEAPPDVPSPNESMMDRFTAMIDQAVETVDVRDRLNRLQAQVTDASEHIINLIVIFLLQTVLLPIAFVWLFLQLLKGIAQRLTGQT